MSRHEPPWEPDPELLAAYGDGELDDRPELRARLEAWLEQHPEAQAELAAFRQLGQLWQETTPSEPSASTWRRLRARLLRVARQPKAGPALRRWGAPLLATAAGLALLVGYWPRSPEVPPPDVRAAVEEVFPVATASEVTILRVEGADTNTLVVGELPVHGPLELAGPGDVALTSVQPDAHDNMVPRVLLQGPQRPIIWARLDAEGE